MNERTKSLCHSLVGSSIGFSFQKNAGAVSVEKNIISEKRRIRKDIELAHSCIKDTQVILMGELTSYYMKEIYYMAVRSEIRMGRLRPLVLDYLSLSVADRCKKLKELVTSSMRGKDKQRDAKLAAVRYFLSSYPSKLKEFRSILSREEFLIVS